MDQSKLKNKSYIDLFCGAGGFSHGFDEQGFKNIFPELSDDYFKLLKENSFYSELKFINLTYFFDYNFNNK